MGQWKTDWSQGYNIPTRHHLFRNKDDGRYVFNYTFDHDFDSIVAENFTLKVILPEGATNIKVGFEIFNGCRYTSRSMLTRLRRLLTSRPWTTSASP